MRRVRASSGRRVAAAAVDVTAVADTVAVGVTAAASEEAAATSQLALPFVLENPLSQRICACRRFDSLR